MPKVDDFGRPIDASVVALARAIRTVESKSNYTAKGKSGEYGAYQWMPGNYEAASKKYFGEVLDKKDPVNQDKVAYYTLLEHKQKGLTPEEIASTWNSGSPKYDGKVGTNKYGVKYDVPAYVDKVVGAYLGEKDHALAIDLKEPKSSLMSLTPKAEAAELTDENMSGGPVTPELDDVERQLTGGRQVNEFGLVPEERGFWGEFLPGAFSVGGAIVGGIAGAPLGPAGIVAGGIAGAGAGAAVGEGIQQKIEKSTGYRKEYDLGQVGKSGVYGAGTQAAGGVILKGAGLVARPLIKAATPSVVKTLKFFSGYSDDIINRALQRTPGAVAGLKEGEGALDNIVRRVSLNIPKQAGELLAKTKAKIAQLSKMSSGGVGEPGVRSSFLKEGTKFISNVTKALRTEHNIGVNKEGTLLFNRLNNPSRFVVAGDQKALQDAFSAMQTIQKNTSISHIDSIMERLIALRSKTPMGSPTGSETAAIIGKMMSSVKEFAGSLGRFSPAYTEYVKFAESNIPQRIMINEAREIFQGGGNLSPAEVSKVSNRMLQLFNSGKNALREGVEQVEKNAGEDVTGAASGVLTKGEFTSQRAPNLSARGIIERAIEAIPRAALKSYIATGKLTAELSENPLVKLAAKVFNTSTKVIIQQMGQLYSDKETE